MKKIIAALALGILVTGSTFAQTSPQKEGKHRAEHRSERKDKVKKSPEDRAKLKTEKLSKQLDLNSLQTKRLMALNLKQAQEMQAMRAQHQKGEKRNPQQREQMKAAHARWNAELKDILTKKQYAQYEATREEQRAKHQQGREHRKGQRGEKLERQS